VRWSFPVWPYRAARWRRPCVAEEGAGAKTNNSLRDRIQARMFRRVPGGADSSPEGVRRHPFVTPIVR
jgi:hypothetical protein